MLAVDVAFWCVTAAFLVTLAGSALFVAYMIVRKLVEFVFAVPSVDAPALDRPRQQPTPQLAPQRVR